MNGAGAIAVDRVSGRIFVSDRGNNRVLSWPSATGFGNGQAADIVLGQPDFMSKLPNGDGSSPSAATLNDPRGLAVDKAGRLFVADYANHRVLGFSPPFSVGQAADVLVGQPYFERVQPNRNNPGPSADSLYHPSGVAFQDNGDLWMADRDNYRVLHYAANKIFDGAADVALGQPDLVSALRAIDRNRLWDPYAIAASPLGDKLYVAEYAANRVLLFHAPYGFNQEAASVLGQPGFTSGMANNGGLSATSLSGPSAVAFDPAGHLYVADYGNSRVLRFDALAAATQVFGQSGQFTTNATGTSNALLDFPDGLATDGGGNLYMADTGNNRVLAFDRPSPYGAPVLSSLFPSTIAAGVPSPKVNVFGTGFTTASTVRVNGNARQTTYRGETWLQVTPSAADLASPGTTLQISVTNPLPGGSVSASMPLTTYLAAASDGLADAIVGQADFTSYVLDMPTDSLRARSQSAIAVNPVTGRLYIADPNRERVLSWPNGAAYVNGQEADLVLGVSSPFVTPPEGTFPTSQQTLNYPAGLAVDGAGNLWVADKGNNRVLRFDAPQTNGMAASVVLGQFGFNTNLSTLGERGMALPADIAIDSSGRLAVADDGNERVLIFDPPFSTGQAASTVLGQPDFVTTTAGLSAQKFFGPKGLAFDSQRRLFVADIFNDRVLGFSYPQSTNEAATIVLGQLDFFTNTLGTSATRLYAPENVRFDSNGYLYVSDGPNSRVLVFKSPFTIGMAASYVIGQPDFTSHSSGRSRSLLGIPLGLALDAARNLFVVDAGNVRVLRFDTPIATPPPQLTSVTPSTVNRGSDGVVLTLKGGDFVLTSKVLWNGAERPTTFVDSTTLTVAIPASDVAAAGTANISVVSPSPGGGTAGPLTVTIVVPVYPVMLPSAYVNAALP